MKIKCSNYNILINDWQRLLELVSSDKYSSVIIIVDENTKKYCLPIFNKKIKDDIKIIEIVSGEVNKTLTTCQIIWDMMLSYSVDRHSLCINLGGGVIGDMGGFVASTFMRGMDFVQIPTTLLSQVDASVGGKLGVDYHDYKNMIGIIREPTAVFIFTEFLDTLPMAQLRSGYAEVIKHWLISDKEGFDTYKYANLKDHDWNNIIVESVKLKKKITDSDPLERGVRKILNFGHTLGHAIESYNLSSTLPLLHGEAIAIGMILETHLSYQNNSDNITIADIDHVAKSLILIFGHHPGMIPPLSILIAKMKFDKKNKSGKIKFSLLNSIGDCTYDIEVNEAMISKAVDYYKELKT
ncbi:MAG: 3-dehydroquinate synthase [Saprospiraceae bacterium]